MEKIVNKNIFKTTPKVAADGKANRTPPATAAAAAAGVGVDGGAALLKGCENWQHVLPREGRRAL